MRPPAERRTAGVQPGAPCRGAGPQRTLLMMVGPAGPDPPGRPDVSTCSRTGLWSSNSHATTSASSSSADMFHVKAVLVEAGDADTRRTHAGRSEDASQHV